MVSILTTNVYLYGPFIFLPVQNVFPYWDMQVLRLKKWGGRVIHVAQVKQQ
jgi:hypothetical protein